MKGDSVQAVDGVDYFFRRALWLAPAFGLILIGVLLFQPKGLTRNNRSTVLDSGVLSFVIGEGYQ